MSTRILIPYPNDRVYCDYDNNGFPQAITDDVQNWLWSHQPLDGYRESNYHLGRYMGESWIFKDANIAMRFKLTFS